MKLSTLTFITVAATAAMRARRPATSHAPSLAKNPTARAAHDEHHGCANPQRHNKKTSKAPNSPLLS